MGLVCVAAFLLLVIGGAIMELANHRLRRLLRDLDSN